MGWLPSMGYKRKRAIDRTLPFKKNNKKMNDSHCPALRRRRRCQPECEAAPSGEAASESWLIGREKSLYYAFRLISCQPRLGTRPGGLGKLQADTSTAQLIQVHHHWHWQVQVVQRSAKIEEAMPCIRIVMHGSDRHSSRDSQTQIGAKAGRGADSERDFQVVRPGRPGESATT
jgi:hypothetical protein